MLFLKNYSKLIKTLLHLAVLVLAVLAIVFTYTNQLFVGDEKIIKDFAMWTYKPIDFSLIGLTGFSNTFIEFSGKLTQINHFIEFKQYMVDYVKWMKIIVIAIIVLHGLFALAQLFTFRGIATFNLCLLNLLALIVLISTGINGLEETKLITSFSKDFITIVILWSCATLVTLLELIYDYIIEKISQKLNKQQPEEM
ncbi:MAG: hypothetical protein IJZ77_05150 [Bacilli bacterium]|nr:hypothetical protein [Bacilli bacterium]